ncbi:MAG: RHS repeat-associated core domain-containing protein, partial [Armatimonadota bacterium]|nr:RHS repeat-associated core domain-containing protein [Armatimonadota bacterium]
MVEERDGAGVLQKRYYHGLELGPVRQDQQNAQAIGGYLTSYYLPDGLDSTRQLSDVTGAVTDSYYYDAFGGDLAGDSGSTPNSYRFNGQQLDAASGLYYLRARYYDQGLGRFISHDPVLGSEQDPISLHRYLYANIDPVNSVDPSGEQTLGEVNSVMGQIAKMSSHTMKVLQVIERARSVTEMIHNITGLLSAIHGDVPLQQKVKDALKNAKSLLAGKMFDVTLDEILENLEHNLPRILSRSFV